MCVLSTDSSLNTNFQNGTAYECNRAWNDPHRVPLRPISSAILLAVCVGCPIRGKPAAPAIQATNVLRIGGKGAAVAVLIFDVLKGMLPVWGAYELGVSPFWLGLIAIAACLGHIWPVFWI